MTFLSRFVFCISMATMSHFSTVANGDDVHIVFTFPAKNAEIFAIFSDIMHLCSQYQSIHSMPRFVRYQTPHNHICDELMADISTSPDAQQFKYGGKVLAANRTIDNRSARRRALARGNRSNGLNLYDFHARQQDAKLGRFNSVDQHSESYYPLSPYSYCSGDPINLTDQTGMNPIYDLLGNFLGTDDNGLISDYLVMDKDAFSQINANNCLFGIDPNIHGFKANYYGIGTLNH